MVEKEYQDLIRLVRKSAGNAFRSAFSYSEGDWTTLYVRDDVATEELEQVVALLLKRAQRYDPIIRKDTYDGLGTYQATAELYEKGVLLHFWEHEQAGVVISLDREAARDMAEFVQHCYTTLDT